MVYFNILKKQGLRQIPICSETMKQIVQIRSKKAISVEISPPLIKQLLETYDQRKGNQRRISGRSCKDNRYFAELGNREFYVWIK